MRNLANLKSLSLHGTETPDTGLVDLRGLIELRELCPEVTDVRLSHLVGLTALKWLDLSGTRVSDEGHIK